MVEVLHFGCHVLFHHLPPVSKESIEFSSNSSESVKAEAHQGEADKTLGKGALELVENSGLGYHIQVFFGVQKASGERRLVTVLLSLKGCHPHQIQGGDGFFGHGRHRKGGRRVLH